MSIPSFGPSQRLELSSRYLDQNASEGKCSWFTLYDRVDPKINVAEEGQVVLLSNELQSGSGIDHHKTEVIPDASGYQLDVVKDMNQAERVAYLAKEITRYNVGVNQVERGVRSPHVTSGYGWDISVASNTGHPVTIRHTGSEKIHRFDLIGIRFPTDADVEAQTDRWNANGGNKGISVSKFATYPVRENWEILKHNRFISDLHALSTDVQYGYPCEEDKKYGRLLYLQLPALLRIVKETLECPKEIMNELELHDIEKVDSDILAQEEVEHFLRKVAMASAKFNSALVPPMVFAQCVSYQCVQPHSKSWAECGDLLNCVFL